LIDLMATTIDWMNINELDELDRIEAQDTEIVSMFLEMVTGKNLPTAEILRESLLLNPRLIQDYVQILNSVLSFAYLVSL
jgi:hypothetical protein